MSLDDHFQGLFLAEAEAGPSSGPKYEQGLKNWENWASSLTTDGKLSEAVDITDDDVPEDYQQTAFPSLVELMGLDEDVVSDEEYPTSYDPSVQSSPQINHKYSLSSMNGSPATSSSGVNLHDRIQRHLPESSTFSSLIGLLSSNRTNDDIQSELVEILGFEGDGLMLVEELMKIGARDKVVEDSGLIAKNKKQMINGNAIAGNRYLPSSRINVTAQKGKHRKQNIDITEMIGSSEDIARRINEQLDRPKAMFHEDGPRIVEQEVLPHVYTSAANAISALSMGGKLALPNGTTRELNETYEEVTVPPGRPMPPRVTERPVKITDLPPLARGCFPKYVTLNRMQSIIQPTAMNTNENLLICAPTGAGKTDIAIMAIIRVLAHHVRDGPTMHPSGFSIDKDAFKVIYVAPMKALASEITRKFGKRLAWLGIKVRELTGDMQMTKQEIADTQIIVTTPEKWDVVTRKPTGEGELASKVKLLIIDEVHLLNEERGAVIETIVARTLRQVESSQSLIRIVGLSATLPNYIDVADFLRVSRYHGLFFFDASFRPVPLEQHFIGVQGKARSMKQAQNLDNVVFEKVSELVEQGHQVMVFVHARKETVKTAMKIKDMSVEEGMTSFFETSDHPKFGLYRREVSTSRNKEMKDLFDAGFGIHHAGMLRSDRNMMEKMFEDQAIKVLCCTSTLAWGVNLPAHAVVIKGTQVYDSSKGAFMDLSVLDVLQIFGRAGRPGYETSGVGYICTSHDKLDQYLYSIMAQHPIESKFIPGMVDSLNAEISLGTIANVQEAIQWLGYTYLFVRMRKEPMIYGMSHDEPKDDPQLGMKRNDLIIQAARQLSTAKMIRYDEVRNTFVISDLGRIAAKYYLKYRTMEIFNDLFNPKMKNADLFAMLSQATEFEQIQVRDNEIDELTAILESDHCPMEVKGGVTSKHGKVNILLQAHISRVFLQDFALVSDAAYVAQNSARIIRALLEIALSRHWANNAILLIDLSKAIERRMWPYEHPLAQVSTLHKDTLYNLKQWADDAEISDLKEMDATAIGEKLHMNEKHGSAVKDAALMFPSVSVEYSLKPLTHDLLQLSVKVIPQFEWNSKISTSAEPFYIWIQDEIGLNILQWRSVLIRQTTTSINIDFLLPFGETPPESISIVSASDRWLGSDTSTVISLQSVVMPQPPPEPTPVLDIPFLHISALQDPQLEKSYRSLGITTLNGFQSQTFWSFYHTQSNILLSAPVSSGKSFMGEVAIWNAFKHNSQAIILVLIPGRNSNEVADRLREIMPKSKGIEVHNLRNHSDFRLAKHSPGQICITTPYALLQEEDDNLISLLPLFNLVIFEDLHLAAELYETAISRILSIAKPCKARLIGLTSSLNDPTDLAEWLGADESNRFSFYPADRGNPVSLSIKSFTIPHSSTLLKSMIKPAYDVLKSSPNGVIIFVPSRSACRSISNDLVTQSGTEMDLSGFLNAARADVEPLLQRLRDPALFEPLLHGIGYLSPNSAPTDSALVLELFASGVIRALIVARELCHSLPVKSDTVLLLGAQFVKMDDHKQDRQIVNYSRTDLVRMQSFAITSASPHSASTSRMFIMCQAEQSAEIMRILNDGLPLESDFPTLLSRDSDTRSVDALDRLLKDRPPPPKPQINRPRIADLRKRDLMDLIGWTYFSKRARSNPTYYGLDRDNENEGVSRMVDKWYQGREYSEPVTAASTTINTRSTSKERKPSLPSSQGGLEGAVKPS